MSLPLLSHQVPQESSEVSSESLQTCSERHSQFLSAPSLSHVVSEGRKQKRQDVIVYHINKLKDKNYMILSLDVEKVFDKNPTPIPDKSPGEIRATRDTFQHNKGSYSKPVANINLNGSSK